VAGKNRADLFMQTLQRPPPARPHCMGPRGDLYRARNKVSRVISQCSILAHRAVLRLSPRGVPAARRA
jgi:hypothetical protein